MTAALVLGMIAGMYFVAFALAWYAARKIDKGEEGWK
jgi:hypothetical protein